MFTKWDIETGWDVETGLEIKASALFKPDFRIYKANNSFPTGV